MGKYQVIDEQTNVESISFELEFAKLKRYKQTAERLNKIMEKERGRIDTASGGKIFINTIDRKKLAPEIVRWLNCRLDEHGLKSRSCENYIRENAQSWLQSIVEQETGTPTPNQYADFVLAKARDQFKLLTQEEWGDDTDYEVYYNRNMASEFSERLEAVEEWAKMKREQPAKADEQSATAQPDSCKKKGRPGKTFKDLMLNDKDGEHLKKIHALMKGKNGKDAALIMLACIGKGWITKPTYTQVKEEFGDIGSRQGFSKYLASKSYFTNDELEGVINSLN